MLLRSLVLLGVSTAISLASPALAETRLDVFPAKSAKASAEQTNAAVKKKKTAAKAQKGKQTARKAKGKKKAEDAAEAKEEAKPLTSFEKRLAAEKKRKDEIAQRTAAIRAKKAEEAEKRAAEAAKKEKATAVATKAKKKDDEPKVADTRKKKRKSDDSIVLASAPVGGAKSAIVKGTISDQSAQDVAAVGNNGELRSASQGQNTGFMAVLFGDGEEMLPQTRALDTKLAERDANRKFQVRDEFQPQTVAYSGYSPGTIVIDTRNRFLYLVESSSSARRYAIAVGREGLEFKGTATVGDKQEWPRWIPTQDMQKREPKKYGQYKDGMPGGPTNPLGARAIYLYQGKTDTHIRIHGTNAPETIGTNSSNGCFRMVNEHVMELYGRVRMGTQVVVL